MGVTDFINISCCIFPAGFVAIPRCLLQFVVCGVVTFAHHTYIEDMNVCNSSILQKAKV